MDVLAPVQKTYSIKFLVPESVRQLNSKEPILLFPLKAATHTLILIML